MADNWYYADKELAVGPLTLQALKEALSTYPNPHEILVWHESFPNWKIAKEVTQLNGRAADPPPLPHSGTITIPAVFDRKASIPLRRMAGVKLFMIIGGLLLSLTGLGAFFGIPMIVIGLFFVPSKSKGAWKGPCPHCSNEVLFAPDDIQRAEDVAVSGFDCPICKNRIVFGNQSFSTVSGATRLIALKTQPLPIFKIQWSRGRILKLVLVLIVWACVLVLWVYLLLPTTIPVNTSQPAISSANSRTHPGCEIDEIARLSGPIETITFPPTEDNSLGFRWIYPCKDRVHGRPPPPKAANPSVFRQDPDLCGQAPCRDITDANSIRTTEHVMRLMATDCRTVREVRILNQSTQSHAIYAVKCDDAVGTQKYQINHEPLSQEMTIWKFSGEWMNTKQTARGPSEGLMRPGVLNWRP